MVLIQEGPRRLQQCRYTRAARCTARGRRTNHVGRGSVRDCRGHGDGTPHFRRPPLSKPAVTDAQCWRTAMNLWSQLPAKPDASARVLRYMRSLTRYAGSKRPLGSGSV
jgi:hypothetical protein